MRRQSVVSRRYTENSCVATTRKITGRMCQRFGGDTLDAITVAMETGVLCYGVSWVSLQDGKHCLWSLPIAMGFSAAIVAIPSSPGRWRRELKWTLAMFGAALGVFIPHWALELMGRTPSESIHYSMLTTGILGSIIGFVGGWWSTGTKPGRSVPRICLTVLLMFVVPSVVAIWTIHGKK